MNSFLFNCTVFFFVVLLGCSDNKTESVSNSDIDSIIRALKDDSQSVDQFIKSRSQDLGQIVGTYKSIYNQGLSLSLLLDSYKLCGSPCSKSFSYATLMIEKVKKQRSFLDNYAATFDRQFIHYCCAHSNGTSHTGCVPAGGTGGGPPFTACNSPTSIRVFCDDGEMSNPDGSMSCNN